MSCARLACRGDRSLGVVFFYLSSYVFLQVKELEKNTTVEHNVHEEKDGEEQKQVGIGAAC